MPLGLGPFRRETVFIRIFTGNGGGCVTAVTDDDEVTDDETEFCCSPSDESASIYEIVSCRWPRLEAAAS